MHSKHVIHVFPRKHKLIISEWARAIRVAHSVKKTFILAIPGKKAKVEFDPKKPRLDFLLYHRKGAGIETPKDGTPRYLMLSLTEDEYIGGEELAEALAECEHFGLEMVMAISRPGEQRDLLPDKSDRTARERIRVLRDRMGPTVGSFDETFIMRKREVSVQP